MENTKKQTLIQLFLAMLYISAFTFGGGFVIVTFMKKKFSDELHWLEENEMLDIIAISQSCPGAIAVNAAILVGWRTAGFIGMTTAVLATVIPPITILSIISLFYKAFASNTYVAFMLSGMQSAVAAVISDVVFSLGSNVIKTKKISQYFIMTASFLAAAVFNVNVIYIIIFSAVLGLIIEFFGSKGGNI